MIYLPKEVKIIDKTYSVKFDGTLNIEKDCSGEIRYRTQEIRLQPDIEGDKRHRESIEGSFFHEIVHGILHAISYTNLRDDEDFVNRLSRVLYQTLRDSGMLTKLVEVK